MLSTTSDRSTSSGSYKGASTKISSCRFCLFVGADVGASTEITGVFKEDTADTCAVCGTEGLLPDVDAGKKLCR